LLRASPAVVVLVGALAGVGFNRLDLVFVLAIDCLLGLFTWLIWGIERMPAA